MILGCSPCINCTPYTSGRSYNYPLKVEIDVRLLASDDDYLKAIVSVGGTLQEVTKPVSECAIMSSVANTVIRRIELPIITQPHIYSLSDVEICVYEGTPSQGGFTAVQAHPITLLNAARGLLGKPLLTVTSTTDKCYTNEPITITVTEVITADNPSTTNIVSRSIISNPVVMYVNDQQAAVFAHNYVSDGEYNMSEVTREPFTIRTTLYNGEIADVFGMRYTFAPKRAGEYEFAVPGSYIDESYTLHSSEWLSNMCHVRVDYPRYEWIWSDGRSTTNLSDKHCYTVLREGIEGFAGSTAEHTIEQSANMLSEVHRQSAYKSREFGFTIAIVGDDHADIEDKRQQLLQALSGEGTLVFTPDDQQRRYIKCVMQQGFPMINNGLPPGSRAKIQLVDVRFVAADPHWYGDVVHALPHNPVEGNVDVDVEGNVDAPCTIKILSSPCTNLTTNQSMKSADGKSIIGLTVTISDTGITAVDTNGVNRIGNFSHDSQFWMLEPGWNEITGAEWVEWRPRWRGV